MKHVVAALGTRGRVIVSLDIRNGDIAAAEAAHAHVYRHVTNLNFHIIFVHVTNALEEQLSANKRML